MTRPIHIVLAAVVTVGALGQASGAFAATDKAFIKTAMMGDNAEVQMGKLAQQRGASQGVRDFGHMLEMDHGMHKQKDVALAAKLGVQPTDDVPAMAKMDKQKLEGLSGAKFDQEFVKGMVKDHKKDIGEYEKQSKTHGMTAQFASDTLPTLNKHLQTAEGLMHGG
jgi:putative membrane protein